MTPTITNRDVPMVRDRLLSALQKRTREGAPEDQLTDLRDMLDTAQEALDEGHESVELPHNDTYRKAFGLAPWEEVTSD